MKIIKMLNMQLILTEYFDYPKLSKWIIDNNKNG
jgi:hypothetical protein